MQKQQRNFVYEGKIILLENWLIRTYYSCGSDIFGMPIYSKDFDFELITSDSLFLVDCRDNEGFKTCCVSFGRFNDLDYFTGWTEWDFRHESPEEIKSNFKNMIEICEFDLDDIFIGLWHRINCDPDYDYEAFKEVIKEMKENWNLFMGKK